MREIVERGLGVQSRLRGQELEDLGEAVGINGAAIATVTYNVPV